MLGKMKPLRTTFGVALISAGATLVLQSSVQAQSPVPLRLKLGVLLAQDGDVRSRAGSTIFGGELDLDLPTMVAGKTRLGIGYFEKSGFRYIPVTVSRIFSPPNPAAKITGSPYFGIGGGGYFLRGGGANEVKLGVFAVGGYEFPRTLLFFDFVEAKYQYTFGGVNGLSPNGLVLMLGKKL